MTRFILATFLVLGWAFFEMSGGADFEPRQATLTNVTVDPLKPAEAVTRVSLDLTSVQDVLSDKPTSVASAREPLPSIVQTAVVQAAETTEVFPSLVANAVPEDVLQTEEIFTAAFEDAGASVVEPQLDLRVVTGSRVNVRSGPGTSYGVVSRVVRGDEIEVLEEPGNGWVRMRPVAGGTTGWMADFLLSEG